MTVLILDQFAGPSPYELQQQPMRFEELLASVRENPKAYTIARQLWRGPKIVEVDDVTTFQQDIATTAFIAGPDGMAQMWRERWDTSG